MDDAIERVRQMQRRIRDQVIARLALPHIFEELDEAEREAGLRDEELEDLMWELDLRHRQSFMREEEL